MDLADIIHFLGNIDVHMVFPTHRRATLLARFSKILVGDKIREFIYDRLREQLEALIRNKPVMHTFYSGTRGSGKTHLQLYEARKLLELFREIYGDQSDLLVVYVDTVTLNAYQLTMDSNFQLLIRELASLDKISIKDLVKKTPCLFLIDELHESFLMNDIEMRNKLRDVISSLFKLSEHEPIKVSIAVAAERATKRFLGDIVGIDKHLIDRIFGNNPQELGIVTVYERAIELRLSDFIKSLSNTERIDLAKKLFIAYLRPHVPPDLFNLLNQFPEIFSTSAWKWISQADSIRKMIDRMILALEKLRNLNRRISIDDINKDLAYFTRKYEDGLKYYDELRKPVEKAVYFIDNLSKVLRDCINYETSKTVVVRDLIKDVRVPPREKRDYAIVNLWIELHHKLQKKTRHIFFIIPTIDRRGYIKKRTMFRVLNIMKYLNKLRKEEEGYVIIVVPPAMKALKSAQSLLKLPAIRDYIEKVFILNYQTNVKYILADYDDQLTLNILNVDSPRFAKDILIAICNELKEMRTETSNLRLLDILTFRAP